ncbi:WD40-like Beta Propeller Repeat protein [compost metagenome]
MCQLPQKTKFLVVSFICILTLVGCTNSTVPKEPSVTSSSAVSSQAQSPVADTPVKAAEAPVKTADTPVQFEEGVLSTNEKHEWAFAFTPEMDSMILQRGNNDGSGKSTLYESHLSDGKWSEPVKSDLAPDTLGEDGDPFISPDGKRLFFATNRTEHGTKDDNDIWVSEREGEKWSAPRPLEGPINSTSQEWLPSVAANGNLYFESDRPGGAGRVDLYVSKWTNGVYSEPERLPDTINTAGLDESPYIAPDESYLMFVRGHRFFISYRVNNEWTEPKAIVLQGDTGNIKYSPYVTKDQSTLYYTSTWRGTADIYKVSFNPSDYKPQ